MLLHYLNEQENPERKFLYNQMMAMSKEDIIRDFFIEMDAKNRAYSFLLERGHYKEFTEWFYKNS